MGPSAFDGGLSLLSDALVRASVQAAGSILILLAIERLVPAIRARWRCWLWRLVYVKLAVVLCLPLAWDLPMVPRPGGQSPKAQPSLGPRVASLADTPDVAGGDRPAISDPDATRRSAGDLGASPWRPSLVAICLGLWAIGVAARVVRHIARWLELRGMLARGSTEIDPELRQLATLAAKELGLGITPGLVVVPGIGSPAVIGLLRPTILWPDPFPPAALPQRTSSPRTRREDRRMALAHEVAHIVRGDLRWNLLAAIVDSILFFHPLLWLAGRRYTASLEGACDESALDRARLDRVRFAELLIRVSRCSPAGAWTPAGAPLWRGRGNHLLRERLTQMQPVRRSASRKAVSAAATVLGLTLAVLPWSIGFAQSSRETTGSESSGTTARGVKANVSVSASSSARASSRANSRSRSRSMSNGRSPGGQSGFGRSAGGPSDGSSSGSSDGSASGSANSTASAGGSVSISIGDADGRAYNLDASQPSRRESATSSAFGSDTGQRAYATDGAKVVSSREVTPEGEEIRVTIQERQRDIQIRQSDADGIEVFIRPTRKNPDQTVTDVTAANAKELQAKSPVAYDAYRKYLGGNLRNLRSEPQPAPGSDRDAGARFERRGSNAATELMRKQLRDMLGQDDLDPTQRKMIQDMLDKLPD
jgi:beta-lactamase regulating signal transducer with metallopeptidase domain